MCPVHTSAPESREGLAKFALYGVRVTEKDNERGVGVCVCVLTLSVFAPVNLLLCVFSCV